MIVSPIKGYRLGINLHDEWGVTALGTVNVGCNFPQRN